MTLTEMVTAVTGNLGNRSEGTIGNESTETVAVRGINIGLPQCVKLANPTAYEKTATLALPSGGDMIYPYPTIEGERIKDIVSYRFTRASDGGRLNVLKVPYPQFVEITSDFARAHQGTPSYWSIFAEEIYINRVPAEDYNLLLYCEVWPKALTLDDANTPLPINTEWELAIEAYATKYCYMKLQQGVQATYWGDIYDEQKSLNTQVKRKVSQRGNGTAGGPSNRDVLDPFVRSTRVSQF